MRPTAYLDIETTGLDPWRHQILEVAIIHAPDDAVVHFSLPIDLTRADPRALEVNKYHQRLPELRQIQVTSPDAVRLMQEALGDRNIVGNNVQFDCRFIEHFFRQYGPSEINATPWRYHIVDLKALVAGRYRLGPAPWKTDDVVRCTGVDLPSNYHSALADAYWNKAVYEEVTA